MNFIFCDCFLFVVCERECVCLCAQMFYRCVLRTRRRSVDDAEVCLFPSCSRFLSLFYVSLIVLRLYSCFYKTCKTSSLGEILEIGHEVRIMHFCP